MSRHRLSTIDLGRCYVGQSNPCVDIPTRAMITGDAGDFKDAYTNCEASVNLQLPQIRYYNYWLTLETNVRYS